MKKLKKTAMFAGILFFIIFIFIVIEKHATPEKELATKENGLTIPEKGPTTTFVFDLDVPTRDNHIVTVKVVADYRLTNEKVILSSEEADNRVYSNILAAFRLATEGAPFEKTREAAETGRLRSEVVRHIDHYNMPEHEVVLIDTETLIFSFKFDPPVDLEDEPVLEEFMEEDTEVQPPRFDQEKRKRRISL